MVDHLYNIDVHAPLRVLFSINILSHPQRLASGVRLFWAGAKLPVPHNRPKSPDSLMTRGAMCSAEAGVTVSPQPAPPKVKFSYNSPSFSLAEKANLVRCFLGVFFLQCVAIYFDTGWFWARDWPERFSAKLLQAPMRCRTGGTPGSTPAERALSSLSTR